jgi:hypothetical protein
MASRLPIIRQSAGGLSQGTADSLQAILQANPNIRIIQLNNDGGRISEGTRLGKLIEAHGLATFTARECVSACLLDDQCAIDAEALSAPHFVAQPGGDDVKCYILIRLLAKVTLLRLEQCPPPKTA